MIKDIYVRDPQDAKYIPTTIDVSDEYEMLYSKILMILSTRKGEVLGEPNLGVSLESKLFTFNIEEETLRQEIFDQVSLYIPESGKFNLNLSVKRMKGTVRDIILLDFTVDGRKAFGFMIN